MMDSLSLSEYKYGDGFPYWITDVTSEKWLEWQEFLKLHDKWDSFWSKHMTKANRNSR